MIHIRDTNVIYRIYENDDVVGPLYMYLCLETNAKLIYFYPI